MNPNENNDAKAALAARGFGTFKKWAKENRKWAAQFRKDKDASRKALAQFLDAEYDRLIKPNLYK